MRARALAAAALVADPAAGCAPGPTPPPSPPAAARAKEAPPSAADPRLPGLLAQTERALAVVSRARALPARGRVDVAVVDTAGVRKHVLDNLYEHMDRATFDRLGRIEATFGAMPAGADPEAVLLSLLEQGVAGFYDAETDTFYVVDHVSDAMIGMVIEHELAHALQDMHFDLERFEKPNLHENDRDAARTLLIEGDAQAAYLAARAGEQGLAAVRPAVLDAGIDQALRLASAHPYPVLARSLQLPYVAGTATVAALVREAGWRAVDALYDDPPATSEQMLHPDKLRNREPPVSVAVEGDAFARATGWRVVWHDVVGEAGLLSMLADAAAPDVARDAAAGWGGDRYVALEPDGGTPRPMIAGGIAWDTEQDAAAFVPVFERYLAAHDATAPSIVQRDGALVRYALAVPPRAVEPVRDALPAAVRVAPP